ncbi:hypothetical protein [Wolbachia endosymbiont of Trichogramma kaykai]
MLSGEFAIGTCLTISSLEICISLAVAALFHCNWVLLFI